MIAETLAGDGAAAHDHYLRINPSAREALSNLHRCEPYVYAQMIAGRDAATHGEAKNSWLTGTAAWNYVAATQHSLGLRPALDGLRVRPVLPPDWPGFAAVHRFRGAAYHLTVERAGPGNAVTLTVDGRPLDGDVLPPPAGQCSRPRSGPNPIPVESSRPFQTSSRETTLMPLVFPSGFRWGTATAAYQIEGAWAEAGKGESVWDRFAHTPGRIEDASHGDIACDHYHRWREDVALMKQLGHNAYRFSIAWPRILPAGRGAVNAAGVDFYSRLVDELLAAGITPFVTLYHWDLPQALFEAGGWPARATAEAFVEYADLVSRALGDRVKHWITHNEPWCVSFLGYENGEHAPGVRGDWPSALATSHHLLLSHGWAVPVLRRNSPGAEVGITLNLVPVTFASPSAADYHAGRRFDGYFNRWFLDPLHGRGYPADKVAEYTAAGHWDPALVRPGDLEAISVDTDFLGVNYYMRHLARDEHAPDNAPQTEFLAPRSEWTDMGWEVYPDGLYQLLCRLRFEYQPRKLYVTENGVSHGDGPDAQGRIADTRRIRYLRDHFAAAHRAIRAGAPLAGYFVWSFMDNFEWGRGYTQRFGLVHVDYATQQRRPKDSARWYRDVIAANALPDEA